MTPEQEERIEKIELMAAKLIISLVNRDGRDIMQNTSNRLYYSRMACLMAASVIDNAAELVAEEGTDGDD